MALVKLEDFDPNYSESFDGNDIKGMGVYTDTDEKIGTVSDALVEEEGHIRYLIVDLGFWIFGKKVLLPVGRARINYDNDRVYAVGMNREQAESLPEFNENMALDYDYEEQVRGVYRSPTAGTAVSSTTSAAAPMDTSASLLDASAPLDTGYTASSTGAMAAQPSYATSNEASEGVASEAATTYNRDTYKYQQEPSLYEMNEKDNPTLRLYEERLIANKRRVKTGEVAVGKHVETETARVSVPIEKERVVIERVTPGDAGTSVPAGEVAFAEGETARMEVYEETPDIRKEAFVREEVRVKKVVDQETVEAQETLRREELDVNTGGASVVDTSDRLPNDRI